jgi:hypothetical protein
MKHTIKDHIANLRQILGFIIQKGNKSLGKPHLLRIAKSNIKKYKGRSHE